MGLTKDYQAQNSLNVPCLLPTKLSNTKKIDVCHWQLFPPPSLAFVYKQESQHSPSSKKLDSSQSLRPWTSGLLAPLSPCLPRVRTGTHSTVCQSLRVCSLTLMDVSFRSFLKKVKQEKLGGIWHASIRSFILPSYLMSKWF